MPSIADARSGPPPGSHRAAIRTHRGLVAGRPATWLTAGPSGAPTVLLLHGGGYDRAARAWAETIPPLSQTYRVVAPDLPGYGGTASLGGAHGIEEIGRWLSRFVDVAGLEAPFHAVGNSMGGATILWLALRHPAKVLSVTPAGSYGLAPRAPLHPGLWATSRLPGGRLVAEAASRSRLAARAGLSGIVAGPSSVTPAFIAELQAEASAQAERQTFRGFLRHEVLPTGFRTCLMPELPRLDCPALFVHGEHDRLIHWRHAEAAARAVPDGRFLKLDAGHWAMRERPGEFMAALKAFLGDAAAA